LPVIFVTVILTVVCYITVERFWPQEGLAEGALSGLTRPQQLPSPKKKLYNGFKWRLVIKYRLSSVRCSAYETLA